MIRQPSFRTKEKINTRINRFKDFTEIIYYKEPFDVWSGKHNQEVNRGYRLSSTEYWNPEVFGIPDFIIDNANFGCIESVKRAKDKFYGYALCNDWQYFCTFTVSINDFTSTDDATKHYWKLFKQKLQYYFKEVKIIAVPERHEKGNLHFHALLGDCDLDKLLTIAISPKTGRKLLRNGRQVYNLPLWNKGFSTVVKIGTGSIEHQLKAINYLIGYVTKEGNTGYNQKRYYRTQNLDFKNTDTYFTTFSRLKKMEEAVATGKLKVHKETKKFKIFRVYN